MNFVSLFVRQALAEPSLPALSAGGRTLTYGQLLKLVERHAARFVRAGVSRGDVVGIAAGSTGYVSSVLALAWIGAVSVDAAGEFEAMSGSVAAVGMKYVFHNGKGRHDYRHEGFRGAFDLNEGEEQAVAAPPAMVEPARDEPCHIVWSSGTTGRPKGIVYTQEAMVLNICLLRVQYPIRPKDRVLIAMPPSMSFAMANWVRCFSAGACAVLLRTPGPDEVLNALREQGITHALLPVGTAGSVARRALATRSVPVKGLRALSVGGARASPQMLELLARHVCPQVYAHYGASEAHLIAVLDNATRARFPQSSGRLLPWIEAEAVGEDGVPLPPGSRGRLRFRSPCLARGYMGATEKADLEAFRDGWFHSSDVGMVRPDGIIFMQGRANDVMNFGGAKVDASALEEAILQDPAISECAAVDVPDELGQPVLAIVIVSAAEEVDNDALRKRCAAVSANCRPAVILRTDSLPRNDSGKVMRGAVRRAVQESPQLASFRASRSKVQ